MKERANHDWRHWGDRIKIVLLILTALLLARLLLPFVLAWGLVFLLQPAIAKLSALTGLSAKTTGIWLLTVTLTLGGGLIVFLSARLLTELPRLIEGLSHTIEELSEKIELLAEGMAQRLPLPDRLSGKERSELIGRLLRDGVSKLSTKVTAWAGRALIRFPGGLLVSVIFWMAAYYFVADFARINRYFASLFPPDASGKLKGLRYRLFSTVASYLRAYLILFAVTFSGLLVVFVCLRVRYGITLAFVAALLDALPAIGVGSILLPWSVAELVSGSPGKGIALIAIWLGVTLLRQLLEPRIVGAKLGLHPLAALAAVWAGFRLLGVWGVLIAPMAAILLRGVLDARRKWVVESDDQ